MFELEPVRARPEEAPIPSEYKNVVHPIPLRLINIVLRLNLLHTNLHALFPKADILLLHLLRCLIGDIRRNRIYRVSNESRNGEHYEEDDERYEFPKDRHCGTRLVEARVRVWGGCRWYAMGSEVNVTVESVGKSVCDDTSCVDGVVIKQAVSWRWRSGLAI